MIAELGLDDVTDLAGLQGERGLFKRWIHLAASKPAQVSTLIFAARIARELLGQLGKILAGASALQYILGL